MIKIDLQNWNKPNIEFSPSIATIGVFDGIHKYHLKILKTASRNAKKNNLKLMIITFDKKVDDFFNNTNTQIASNEAKMIWIEKHIKPDYFITLTLNETIINATPEEFIAFLTEQLNVIGLVEGEDFTYGAKGVGNIFNLQSTFKSNLIIIERDNNVSSSQIKMMLNSEKTYKKAMKQIKIKPTN